jgi:hypothetical protein
LKQEEESKKVALDNEDQDFQDDIMMDLSDSSQEDSYLPEDIN